MIDYAVLCIENQAEGLAAVHELLLSAEYHQVALEVVSDDNPNIRRVMRTLVETKSVPLVLTIGGSFMGTRERVPEVTLEIIERQVPGLAELIRLAGVQKSRRAALWRGVAGWKNKSLVINLPAQDTKVALEAILPVLPLAVSSIQ